MRNEWPLPPAEIEQAERPASSWTPPEYPPAPLPRLVHPAPIQDPALHNDVRNVR